MRDYWPVGWARGSRLGLAVILAIVCLAGLGPSGPVSPNLAYGQDGPEPGEACSGGPDGMLTALDLNWDRQVALMRARGFDPRDQARAVARWLEGLPHGAAALILASESDRHCAYLVDRLGLQAFSLGPVSPEALKVLHADWRRAAGVDQTGAGKRGLTSADGPGGRSRAERSKAALSALTTGILPGSVQSKIGLYRRLLVLPYGDLGAVPYSALPVGGQGQMMVDLTAVMVLPGVQLAKGAEGAWVNRRGERRCPAGPDTPGPALVVGDPAVAGRPDLPPLPGARREAISAARIYGVTPLLGGAASLRTIQARAAGAGIIHLAAYGVALPDMPLDSYIALADGPWRAGDIMQSCLQSVRIVVLSACQTGLGRTVDGGVIGLARAFHLAGVDDVVMTLWSVDDAATELLMTRFATFVQGGLGADEALRQAMQVTRKAYPDPVLWASFSVFGSSMLKENEVP